MDNITHFHLKYNHQLLHFNLLFNYFTYLCSIKWLVAGQVQILFCFILICIRNKSPS